MNPRNKLVRSRSSQARLRPFLEDLEGRALMSYIGSLDTSYKSAVLGNLAVGTSAQVVANDEAVQADGKVVVTSSYSALIDRSPVPASFFAVTRLNTDGTLDTTFGSSSGSQGAGRVALFPTISFTTSANARALAIQPDGKIVVAGDVAGMVELVRLNPDGSLDSTFGTGGEISFQFGGLADSQGDRVALQPDGKIVVGGFGEDALKTPTSVVATLARFNADGSVDTGFGTQGQVAIPIARLASVQETFRLRGVAGLAIQLDGKIVVDATSTSLGAGQTLVSRIAVDRLNANGTLDTTFGTGGSVTLPAQFAGTAATSEVASTILARSDGLIVVGTASVPNPSGSTPASVPFAARLNSDGTIDTTFGQSGASVGDPARSSIPTGQGTEIAALDQNGPILLGFGGTAGQPILLRLFVNGTIDFRFGESGLARISGSNFDESSGGFALATQADGKILVGVGSANIRLLAQGAAGDFDNDGITDRAVYLTKFGAFAYRPSGGGPDVIEPFGSPGPGQTLPAPGAYDGNGVTELGVYLPSLGAFGVRPYPGAQPSTNGADVITYFGIPGAGQTIPVPGDYDGSGKTELAVYLPRYGAFVYRPAIGGADVAVPFGFAGLGQTIPAPGDYFGTGQTDIAAYLPALGAYALRDPRGGPDQIIPFGIPGAGQSIPVPGDYDGSGKTELGVYLPSFGVFAYRPARGGADVIVPFGLAGAGQSLPALGDYTGLGLDELGVYLPGPGVFANRPYLPTLPSVTDQLEFFGIPGPGQTIPFNQVSATTGATSSHATAASVEIPISPVPDDLTGLATTFGSGRLNRQGAKIAKDRGR